MADSGGSIIIGKIDDTAMRKSINDLAKEIDKKTKEMATSFDSAIGKMVESINKLGTATTNLNTQSIQRIQALKKEQDAVKENTMTYDQMAQAVQKITKDSQLETYQRYISVIRKMIARWHLQLKDISQQKFVPTEQMDKLKSSIESTEQKLAQLNKRLQYERAHGQHDPSKGIYSPALARVTQEIEVQQDRLRKLQEELNRVGTAGKEAFNAEKQAQIQAIGNKIDAAKAKIKEYSAIIFGLMQTSFQPLSSEIEKATQKEQQLAQATKEAVQVAKQYTDEIKKQAQAIRESAEMKSAGKVTMTGASGYQYVISADTDRLSIEQQLVDMKKYENELSKEYGVISKQNVQSTGEQVVADEKRTKAINEGLNAARNMQEQFASNGRAEMGVNSLRTAIYQMHNAYALMSDEMKKSDIGQNLKRQLDVAKRALEQFEQSTVKTKRSLSGIQMSEKDLSNTVSELTNRYKRMDKAMRESAEGQELLTKIQRLKDALHQLHQEMNRPVNLKNTLNLPENTYDNLTYKIQRLQSYMNGLDLNKQKKEIEDVSKVIEKLRKRQEEIIRSNKRWSSSNESLSRTLSYIRNRLAFMFSVGATTNFVKQVIEIRGQYEMLERSLQVLTDSAAKGSQIFNELNQMALNSPFTTIELSEAARQMVAYGVATEDVVEITRRLADISAAVGQPIERLTYAFGQVQTYGYLTSIQAKTFMRTGIPLVKELAEMYSELEGRLVSTAEVYQRMKQKQISYNDVMKVVNRETDEGGKFFQYQAKMAETLRIQLANLSLAWNNMLNDIGKSNQSIITAPIKLLKTLFANWKSINSALNDVLITLGTVSAGMFLLIAAFTKWNWAAASSVVYGERLTAMFTRIGKGLWAMLTSSGLWITLIATFTYELLTMFKKAETYTKDINNAVRESVKESIKSLDDFISKNREVEKSLYKTDNSQSKTTQTSSYDGQVTTQALVPNDLPLQQALDVWSEIKEEINNSSNSADNFIAQLEKIDDVNERVRQGFKYVRSIKDAQGEIQQLNKDIVVTSDLIWGLFGEGLKSDVDDFVEYIHDMKEWYKDGAEQVYKQLEDISAGVVEVTSGTNYQFVNETKASLDSLIDYVDTYLIDTNPKLFNADDFKQQIVKAQELFDTWVNKTIEETKMGTEQAYQFRRLMDNNFREHYSSALKAQIQLDKDGNKEIYEEQLRIFNDTYQNQRTSVQAFMQWLKDTHRTQFEQIMSDLRDESSGTIDWASDKAQAKINELLESFKKNNEFAYLDLKGKVDLANMFTVNIGVFFNVDDSSLNAAINRIAGTNLNLGNIGDTAEAAETLNKQYDEANNKLKEIGAQLKAQDVDVNHIEMAFAGENEILKNQIDNYKTQKKLVEDIDKARQAIHASPSKQENKEQKEAEKAAAKAKKQAEIEEKRRKKQEERDAAKAKREAEKAERERIRKQKEEEQELAKALKDEVSLVDKLRSSYDKLRKSGVAPDMIASVLYTNYEDTFKDINKSLKKYGLEEISVFDLIDPLTKEFKNDQNVFEFFTQQLKKVKNSGRSTRETIKALEEELAKMREELQIKGMEGILKTLKENLDFASNEYELSLDVEENPELADLMSSMMNVDITDMLKDAPKSLREYTDKVNGIIDGAIRAYWVNMNPEKGLDEYFTEFNARDFNILDKDTFDKIRQELTPDSQLFKEIEKLREDLLKKNRKFFDDVEKTYEQYLQKHGDYADKIRKIEEKKYSDLKTLDDVYNTDALKSTYDYQRRREAIIQSAKEAKQKTDFDEFKESETYLELFDNLDYASETTLTMMINKIREMRQELTDLDPSELKKLAEYEQQLRDQMVKRNPFKNFKKEFKEYVSLQKQRKQIEKNAVKAEDEVKTQQKIVSVLSDQLEQMKANGQYGTDAYKQKEEELKSENKKLGVLKKQNKAAQQQVTTLNQSETAMRQRASSMADFLGYALDAANALNQIAQESNNIDLQNATEATSDILGNLQAAAQGFAQGGVWGAVAAGVMDLAPKLVKWFNKETAIDKAIQRSEREVKKLQNTLKNLEDTAEDAYGAVTIGAQNAIRANKELQLVELERQLKLEQSRKKKKRDQDKIIDLKGQIIDLRNEINNSSEDVVNDLLGISGAGSWAEELVSSMIEAFRNGEDAMEKFSEKWDEMIDNMIMKYIVSTVMQRWWDNVLKGVEDIEEQYTADIAKEKADAQRLYDDIQGTSLNDIETQMIRSGYTNALIEKFGKGLSTGLKRVLISDNEAMAWKETQLQAQQQVIDTIDERLNQASIDATKASMDYMLGRKGEGEAIAQQLKDTIGQYYQFGESANKDLSQLQQGIQGITEDTASALESYMNGVSQQVYLQSDLMTQIRDVVVGYDPVLSMGLQSQMLLELQNSYQIQVAIQNILVGWSNPSGNAVQVSLI